jgi:hypothetical protein
VRSGTVRDNGGGGRTFRIGLPPALPDGAGHLIYDNYFRDGTLVRVIVLRHAIERRCLLDEWANILLQRSAKNCTLFGCMTGKSFVYLILQWQPICIYPRAKCFTHLTFTPKRYECVP